MKTIILLILSSIIISAYSQLRNNNKERNYITFEDAITKKYLQTIVLGTGGHQEECIEVVLKNISNIDTVFYFEPGRRLISADSTVQDILIVKEKLIMLAAGQEATIKGYGFCCQVNNSSPLINEQFIIGGLADKNLVKLAGYFNKKLYPIKAMQGAVWVISDNNPIACISSNDTNDIGKIRELQKFVAKLKGLSLEYVWYSIKYKNDSTMLFSGVADTLFGEIEYQFWNNCEANMIMYNEQGNVLHRFFAKRPHNPNKYSYKVKFSVDGWQKGTYYIRLFADGQMKVEKQFEL